MSTDDTDDSYRLQPRSEREKPDPAGSACPECGAELSKEAVLCVNCGLDLRTGRKVGEVTEEDAAKAAEEAHWDTLTTHAETTDYVRYYMVRGVAAVLLLALIVSGYVYRKKIAGLFSPTVTLDEAAIGQVRQGKSLAAVRESFGTPGTWRSDARVKDVVGIGERLAFRAGAGIERTSGVHEAQWQTGEVTGWVDWWDDERVVRVYFQNGQVVQPPLVGTRDGDYAVLTPNGEPLKLAAPVEADEQAGTVLLVRSEGELVFAGSQPALVGTAQQKAESAGLDVTPDTTWSAAHAAFEEACESWQAEERTFVVVRQGERAFTAAAGPAAEWFPKFFSVEPDEE